MNTSPRRQYPGSTEACWWPVTLSSGNNVAVAGQPNTQVKVYAIILTAAASLNITFKDGATPFSGAMSMTAMALDLEDKPMITSIGNDFVINSTGVAAGSVFASRN